MSISATFVTYSGRIVDLTRPDPEVVSIEDVAHSLSMTCRWGGHCRDFYSVAEHSVNALMYVLDITRYPGEARDPLTARQKLAVLLHDAHEAYVGDVMSPMKPLFPEYSHLEDTWKRVVAVRFGFLDEFENDKFQEEVVKRADASVHVAIGSLDPAAARHLFRRHYDRLAGDLGSGR